ncbi:MAG: hypothetical protein QOK17_678 [Sphingomonadales bacterium]|jgi:uncharacterized protein (DUF2235 family)|nr:hypothetical protein [Sphingomonadales bacterium]
MGDQGKSIVLFSDGTGNSSAKLFKTNVWRMYEAVDLGPSPDDRRDQISFYDDGVGTSGFKPLAALGGAFGWGLKRNVLDIYRFACRNYRDGDQIYGFGFSRGAFTMRLVIALIASQGLVTSEDETELVRKSKCAYRAFRAAFLPRKLEKPTLFLRRLRDKWTARRERRRKIEPYNRQANCDPVIRFVGVWDTVAAYGGPIAEMTRAVDNWLYPLSMPDYELSEKVECARHALALDDERDAFQPLLWDEVAEKKRADEARQARLELLGEADAERKARNAREAARLTSEAKRFGERERHFRSRLQQVWFTGMHADVGGGYPDESLSYVSLLWMMEEAERAGLRTLDTIKNRFFALANSYGPMHDSRSGFGAYYRYQPRKIAAWMEPTDDRYLMLRDPDIEDASGREHGLLRNVLVHESVIARIDTGTVRYAPVALPGRFDVIPPQEEGEKIEQADSEDDHQGKDVIPPSEPLIGPDCRARLASSASGRFACQENLWDFVWRRRIAYFATVGVTLLLVVLPAGNPLPFLEYSCSDARCVLPSLIRSANVLVPGFAEGWIDAIAEFPVTALIYFIAIVILLRWGNRIERRLGDRSWRLWRAALDGLPIPAEACAETKLRRIREGSTYQKLFRQLKWFWLPAFFGVLMVAVLLYVPLVGLTQASLAWNEATHHFCRQEAGVPIRPLGRAQFMFDTSLACVTPHLGVKQGQVYEIALQLPLDDKGEPAPWFDAGTASQPGSLTRIRASSFAQLIGMPMRRVIEASYLQPLAQISSDNTRKARPSKLPAWLSRLLPHFERAFVTKLAFVQDQDWPEIYRARFEAPATGQLHLFANEAQFPFGAGKSFYRNNCGVALVTITHIHPRRQNARWLVTQPGPAVELPACARPRLDEQAKESQRD